MPHHIVRSMAAPAELALLSRVMHHCEGCMTFLDGCLFVIFCSCFLSSLHDQVGLIAMMGKENRGW